MRGKAEANYWQDSSLRFVRNRLRNLQTVIASLSLAMTDSCFCHSCETCSLETGQQESIHGNWIPVLHGDDRKNV